MPEIESVESLMVAFDESASVKSPCGIEIELALACRCAVSCSVMALPVPVSDKALTDVSVATAELASEMVVELPAIATPSTVRCAVVSSAIVELCSETVELAPEIDTTEPPEKRNDEPL